MIAHMIAGALLAVPGVVILADATDAATDRTPPCHYEDGSGQARCVWDARHMGDGSGRSVVIRHGGTDDMSVTVVSHKRAHRLMVTNR